MTDPVPVKPPQSRHGRGTSAVYLESAETWKAACDRVYVKRQDAYWCRPAWRLFRKTPTLRRELRGLRACEALGINVPQIVSYQESGLQAELVLAEVVGLPLDQALVVPGADRPVILQRVATAIATLHRGGWSHGALYPAHILVGEAPAHQVTLIDLEKARHTRLRRRTDLERFWRHQPSLDAADRRLFNQRYQAVLRQRPSPTVGTR